jgi:hypothetical protein
VRHGIIPPCVAAPTEFLATSRPPDLSVGVDSSELSRPFNGILGRAPYGAGCLRPPWFRSQAFSTSQRFPGRSEFHGLVSCRNRSWAYSFRAFPSQDSRNPLSGPVNSLAVIHHRAGGHDARPYQPRFHRRPRLAAQLPGSPATYGSPFHEPKPASRSPWATRCGTPPFRQLHPLRSLLLLRVRSHRPGFPRAGGRCSPGVLPLQRRAYPNLGTSDPNEPKGPNPHPRPQPPASDAADSVPPEGVPSPSTPGEPCPALRVTLVRPRRQSPAPFGTGPRRLLGDVPAPPALDLTVARPTLTHEAFKCLESGGSP